ncbi:MAG: universal stress protein [Burkholderiales bacterium]|nr:universal stress protein [Burkholderiales bacterium]
MYQHLLVPVDGTDLSVEVVGQAVGLARWLGARITFFHATPDHAASLQGDAEALRLAAPQEYDYAYRGRARELLAKAEAAARACGVPCDALHTTDDQPARAIVAAARSTGCDLIFMASHGSRTRLGMALASETLTVLMNAGLPVLVAATRDPPAPARAIGIIRDEHRSLAAVLHAWGHALAEARTQGGAADAVLMQAILRYLQQFPVALHHPKEDEYLFRRLRKRSPALAVELDELERQHERDRQWVAELALAVQALADAPDDDARVHRSLALEQAVTRYTAFVWEHLGREEGVILPAAQRVLTAADWVAIDAAFAQNEDPRFSGSSERELRQLFSRIVNLAGTR